MTNLTESNTIQSEDVVLKQISQERKINETDAEQSTRLRKKRERKQGGTIMSSAIPRNCDPRPKSTKMRSQKY